MAKVGAATFAIRLQSRDQGPDGQRGDDELQDRRSKKRQQAAALQMLALIQTAS